MRNLSRFFGRLAMATGVTLAALTGFGTLKADAQYNNDPYTNQGYPDQNYGYDDYNYNSNDYMAFYQDLAPHGQWFRDPRYGMVWVPRVSNGFVPYQTNGYWAMTQYGNTWMSSYSWGWAAFHYGRWTFDQMFGWIWLPGRTWGPAWVSWRQGGGYYGWAPLGPGMNYNMSFGYNAGFNCWTFVPMGNIYHTGGYNRYMRNVNVYNVYNQTTVINNYNRQGGRNIVLGPSRRDVEGAARRPVQVYRLEDRNTRGTARVSGNNISMYRPDVQRTASSARPVDTRNVRTIDVSTRNAANASGAARNNRTDANAVNRNNSTNTRATRANNSSNTRNVDATRPNMRTDAGTQQRQAVPASDRTRNVSPSAPARTVRPQQSNGNVRQAAPAKNRTVTPAPRSNAPARSATPSRSAAPVQQQRATPAPAVQQRSAPRQNVQRNSNSAPRVQERSAAPAKSNATSGGGRR